MVRFIQIFVALVAIAFEIAAIRYFGAWLARTDWLMGHTYGPPSYIITALWTASGGVIATVLWLAITLFRRLSSSVERRKRDVATIVQAVILVLLLVPAGCIATISFSELPRARMELRIQHIKAGEATVAELVEALNSPEHQIRWHAVQALTSLGPRASPAVPGLARALNDRALSWDAAHALAAIGPDAHPAIPALIDAIKRERGVPSGVGGEGPSTFSWLAGKALTKIGPASLPALVDLLSHEDRYVRLSAANAIGNMGPQAMEAVPALTHALNDENPIVRQWARLALDRIEGRRPVAD